MCNICKGTQKIQLFMSIVDCECTIQSTSNIQYDEGSGIPDLFGDRLWRFNGRYHRVEGPAIEWSNGDRFWYQNGKLHREDGPAIECVDGHKDWYINGRRLTKEEFLFLKRTQ